MSHVIGVFKPSTLVSTYVLIRSSEAVISFLTSSLTIKRILSRSASVNSLKAGNEMTQNKIERSKIVFMGNLHVITHLTLARWVADPYREIELARLPT